MSNLTATVTVYPGALPWTKDGAVNQQTVDATPVAVQKAARAIASRITWDNAGSPDNRSRLHADEDPIDDASLAVTARVGSVSITIPAGMERVEDRAERALVGAIRHLLLNDELTLA